ncbi:aldo/keto reductase [Thalassospira mesophila]|uniref:Oxidoreductase n=1 Tax=Thalassospira mesophila TaxID=1293891 RepID=A0A1Y2KX60_9PROT|nr:aldo/keto reductase [Thalassospira mesophila]OSQ35737.1 oxidoreductase [Thalassospira mesophila]
MRYHLLGTHTGLRVSELVLGTGTFGTRWGHGASFDETRRILTRYIEAGGNFIDTADSYQFGESEEWLGQLLGKNRPELVLASKYTMGATPQSTLAGSGNSRKNMITSVEASLKRLKTDYLDLYWVHFSDGMTPTDEILRGFDDLARAGKILYAGLSDFPAWRVSRMATLAELRNQIPVAALQVEHSLVQRTTEQELLPMADALGMGVLAWSPLGGGMLTGKYRNGETGRAEGMGGRVFQPENSAQRTAILDTVIAIANELGVTPGQVAIAWVAGKGSLPIIGPRTVVQLDDNLAASSLVLSADDLHRLDTVSALEPVFPYSMIHAPETRNRACGGLLSQIEGPMRTVA